MTLPILIFSIGTVLFILAMVRQFRILATARDHDPLLKGKLFFFLFNLFNVLTTATLICAFYFKDEQLLIPSSVFYTVSGAIAVWTYYSKQKL